MAPAIAWTVRFARAPRRSAVGRAALGCALAAVGLAAAPSSAAATVRVHAESRDEQAYRRQMNDFGECIYRMMPKAALAAVISADGAEMDSLVDGEVIRTCVQNPAGISFASDDLRNVLARGAFLHSIDPAELPADATKRHRYVYPDATPLNDTYDYYRFSECVFLADQDGSSKFLRAVPGSSAEASALSGLASVMDSCASNLDAPIVQLFRFTSSLSHVAFLHTIKQPFTIAEAVS